MGEDVIDISRLKGTLIEKDASPRLRGSLVERREQSHNNNLSIAATLNTESDEDGPPTASFFKQERETRLRGSGLKLVKNDRIGISFASVADGLGGAGSRLVRTEIDGIPQEKSMAYIAARKAQEAANKILHEKSQALTGNLEEIRALMENELARSFSTIVADRSESRLKSKMIKDFPTTFSAAVVQETAEGKKTMLFWAGDSPLFIFTPGKIFTTHTPGGGDAPVESLLYLNNYNLNASQLDFPPDTPLLVAAASDGVLKLDRNDLQGAINLILEGIKSNSPSEVGDKLRAAYQTKKELGGVERDDTTIAIVGSLKPGDISKLNASAPIQIIAPKQA